MRSPRRHSVALINQLIFQVRKDHKLTRKEVAFVSGYTQQAIHLYEEGKRSVPADYLAGLFRAAPDVRLLQYIHPRLRVEIVPAADESLSPIEAHGLLVSAIDELSAALKDSLSIIRDGEVTPADALAFNNCLAHMDRVGQCMARYGAATRKLLTAPR